MSRSRNLLITQHRIEGCCSVCNFFTGKAGDFGATLVTLVRMRFEYCLRGRHGMTTESHSDLRNAVRFPLHLPVTLKTPYDEYRAETIDISAGGIRFRTESNVEVGLAVEFTVAMPGDVLGTDRAVLVKCQGRVVRCNQESTGRTVAVVIDEYKFERL